MNKTPEGNLKAMLFDLFELDRLGDCDFMSIFCGNVHDIL